MGKHTTAYIGLGSNVGDRGGYINKAVGMLTESEQIEVVRVSDRIETTSLGRADEPRYINAVAEIETLLTARDLHERLAHIEALLGRERQGKWSPRTIDLDLLLFDGERIDSAELTVPHRQMHLRSFVLKGLCQLNSEVVHPVIGEPVNELAARLGGSDFVLNGDMPQLISVAGIIGVGKTTLAGELSKRLGGKLLLEPYDKNPFMPKVYAGEKELALDSQLYFLTHRIQQLNGDVLTRGQIAVSDYVFDKELIYARRLLNAQQLSLYERIYQSFTSMVVPAVLVIYLQDSTQSCLERIHRRSRPYEQKIRPQFLENLSADYERLFADWKISPVIRISMSKFDCTKNGDVVRLANQVKHYVAA